jgi:predicted amidohydrolase YtcJ
VPPDENAADFVVAGRVLTVGPDAIASAVRVRRGQITAVGGAEVVAAARADGIPVRDVGDRAVVPGFVDPHIHLEHLAVGMGRGVDCRVPTCRTLDDVLSALRAGLDRRSCDWLIGYANLFFDQKIAEHRPPSRAELDSVSTRVPIALHLGGHVSILNTRALELADVRRFAAGSSGLWGRPVVHTDAAGRPTGLVGEIDRLLPIPEPSGEERATFLRDTYRDQFTRHGVTTFGEMTESEESVGDLDRLIASGDLAARGVLYAMSPSMRPLQGAVEWAAGFRSASGADRLRAGGVKLFADGGYSARNAAARSAYVREHAPHPGYRGRLNLSRAEVARAAALTRDANVQLAVHANGTRAQDEALAGVLACGRPYERRPVRIEHLGNVVADLDDIGKWQTAHVIPVVQPAFLYNFVGDFVPMLLGDAGRRGRLPLRSMLDDGVRFAASSDVALGAEIDQANPLFGIWSAMARRSYWDLHVDPEEAITFSETLRLYTLDAARALGADESIGSIAVGKHADLVVLDRDPSNAPAEDIRDVQVDSVYFAGREVFRREGTS